MLLVGDIWLRLFDSVKYFMEGEHVEMENEVNMTIITLQVVPKGFSTHFTLFRHAQTINESNDLIV